MSGERRSGASAQPEPSAALLQSEAESSATTAAPSVRERYPQFPHQKRLVQTVSTPTPAALYNMELGEASHVGSANNSTHPKLARMSSVRNAVSVVARGSSRFTNRTASFFGGTPRQRNLSIDEQIKEDKLDLKWARRRLRFINRRYGGYKEEEALKELGTEEVNDNIDLVMELATPTAILPPFTFSEQASTPDLPQTAPSLARSGSVDSSGKQKLVRRDSVAKMAFDGLTYFIQRGALRAPLKRQSSTTSVQRERSSSMSFAPVIVQPYKSGSVSRRSSVSRQSSLGPTMELSPRIVTSTGSPFSFRRRHLACTDLGSADSRRSGRTGYEAIQMSKIEEEEPDLSFRKQSAGQSSDEAAGETRGLPDWEEELGNRIDLEAEDEKEVAEPYRVTDQSERAGIDEDFGSSRAGDRSKTRGISGFSKAQSSNLADSATVEEIIGREMPDAMFQIFPAKMDSFTKRDRRESETGAVGRFGRQESRGVPWSIDSAPLPREFHDGLDERDWTDGDDEFFGIDQVSLAADEEFKDFDTQYGASPATSFDRQFSLPAEAGTRRVSTPRRPATTSAASVPNPFVFPAVEKVSEPESQKTRLLQRMQSVEQNEDSLITPPPFPPPERPTSLGLVQGGRLLQHLKTAAEARGTRTKVLERVPFRGEWDTAAKLLPARGLEGGDADEAKPSEFMQRIQHIKKIFRIRGPRQPKSRFHGVGFGIWRKFFRRKLNQVDRATADEIESFEDHRPFFTYYVTSVQILVCIASIFFYGFGPVGFERRERTATVLHTSVVLRQVSIYELENFWLGPKFSDLVHLGAKYSPCMRWDRQIYEQIEMERTLEKETGCCVYNDGVGCFQASRQECPSLLASLVKWSANRTGPHGRVSGAVCGQDPGYCEDPVSVQPYVWPDDITKWPICRRHAPQIPEDQKHLQCEITGRPCCILLHGQCRIATREYCDFVHGYYHANATLCSQVSCVKQVCGMLPFLYEDRPDQFYRLFLSLFLHAGGGVDWIKAPGFWFHRCCAFPVFLLLIIHCAATVLIHWYYMRDLEKLIGWGRMAILYLGSGIGGNLASALLMPYKPEVGPSGSLIGIFSSMFADVIYNWKLIAKPWEALKELSLFTILLFAAGTLPWIDNWAHIFGFFFGLLISLGTFPYIDFGGSGVRRRVYTIIGCWIVLVCLYLFFLLRFYRWPTIDWKWTEYINCIPFTDHLCDNQGVELKTWLNI